MSGYTVYFFIWHFIFIWFSTCSTTTKADFSPIPDSVIPADSTIVFEGVNLITMEDEGILKDRMIIIEDGLIQKFGKTGTLTVPQNAVVVDARGRYMIPGLFDMHVHLNENDLPRYLAYGITGVRNMWGTPNVDMLRRQIEDGRVRGPVIYSASPGIDGTPPAWPYTQVIEDPAEAPALVQRLKNEGWEFLKVYNSLTPEVYQAINEAAREQDIRFLGHVPLAITIHEALEAGQYSIEHLTGYDRHLGGRRGFRAWTDIDETLIPEIVEKTRQAGTWVSPTLVVLDHLSRQMDESQRIEAEENRLAFIKALYEANVGLLLGSDAGIDLTKPGESLHEELRKFENAGIALYNILQLATAKAAGFLGVDAQMGTITPGKRANLVLLEADPLEDMDNISRVDGIVLDGEWIPVSRLR